MHRAIYLDTNIFFHCHFNFADKRLVELCDLAGFHNIQLWSSDIAFTELQVAVRERLRGISAAVDHAKNILEHCVGENPIDNTFVENAIRKALDKASYFFQNEQVELLTVDDLDESDISSVFKDYFNRRGCFAADRKKTEFPDAFQVSLILRKVRCGDLVAVLSSDGDFSNAFASINEVRVYKSIEQLIMVLKSLPPPKISTQSEENVGRPHLQDLEFDILSRVLHEHETFSSLLEEITHDLGIHIERSKVIATIHTLLSRGLISPLRFNKVLGQMEEAHVQDLQTIEGIWIRATPLGLEEYHRQHWAT